MLYFVSPYYKKSVYTGANKRFNELGRQMLSLLGDNFRIVVCEGERPSWAPAATCLFVKPYRSKRERIQTFYLLRKLLYKLEPATIVNDFMPIPFSALSKHRHYQLIHDLRNFTEFRRGGLSFLTARFQQNQLARSRNIITVSGHTKRDLMRFCGIPENRIVVSFNGIGKEYLQSPVSADKDIDILYIATFEERKNHRRLMQALDLSNHGLRVQFVGQDLGTKAEIVQLAERLIRKKGFRIQFITSLSEGELIDAYKRTRVYAFPSLLEGFGMPLIEALALDCRVVCSDLAVFREICGNHAEYFNARDPSSIWASIQNSLLNENTRDNDDLIKPYLWENIAVKLLQDLGCVDLRQSPSPT